jgi:hypothetical protein
MLRAEINRELDVLIDSTDKIEACLNIGWCIFNIIRKRAKVTAVFTTDARPEATAVVIGSGIMKISCLNVDQDQWVRGIEITPIFRARFKAPQWAPR